MLPNDPALTPNQTYLMHSYQTSMNLYNFKIHIYFAGNYSVHFPGATVVGIARQGFRGG